MKIALTGAHGVGKSTLAHSLLETLSKQGKTVVVTPEVPRLICDIVDDKEYFRRGNNSLLKQSLIMLGQLVIEERAQNVDFQICDRTLFDHWAYSLSLFKEEITTGKYEDLFEHFIKEHCQTYEAIFYIPIEFAPKDDGVREDDVSFQKEIDSLIVGLLNKHKINYVQITGSIDERTTKILQAINF